MAEEVTEPTAAQKQEQERKQAIKAYYDATTKEDKAKVVRQYPFLASVFSELNHS